MTPIEQQVADLRAVADFLEAHPTVGPVYTGCFVSCVSGEKLKSIARELGSFEKRYGDDFRAVKKFGDIEVLWIVSRDEICQRVVVGTKEVEARVIPASQEQVIPAHTEEIVQWVCSDAVLGDASVSMVEA